MSCDAHRTCLSTFSKRDAFEGTKGRFKKVADLEPAIALLCDHGYARERVVEDRLGPGRRSSPIYDVNPHLHSQNSHNWESLSYYYSQYSHYSQNLAMRAATGLPQT